MNVRVYIPKYISDMGIEWSDRELVFLAFMLEVSYAEGWETAYYMHNTDFTRILGYHSLKVEAKLPKFRPAFKIAKLSDHTIRIQGKSPDKYFDGNIVRSELKLLTDYKAIAIWYYLAGHMVKGLDHMFSDHKDGKEIVYTHRTQGQYEASSRIQQQLEVLSDAPERD